MLLLNTSSFTTMYINVWMKIRDTKEKKLFTLMSQMEKNILFLLDVLLQSLNHQKKKILARMDTKLDKLFQEL